jgi:hypothetical protein
MEGTLRTQNLKILSTPLSFKCKIVEQKSDAQVGRVNTFHILQTIRKGPLNFKLCMKDP